MIQPPAAQIVGGAEVHPHPRSAPAGVRCGAFIRPVAFLSPSTRQQNV